MRSRALLFSCGLVLSALITSGPAFADTPPRVHLSAAVAHAVNGPQETELGFGGVGDIAVEVPFGKYFGVQGELGGIFLADGSPPTDPRLTDRGAAGGALGMVGVRVHDPVVGLWADLNGGVAVSAGGHLAFDSHVGWDFALDSGKRTQAGPMIGYLHVVQPDNTLRPEDAHVFSLGAHVVFDTAPGACADADKDAVCDAVDVCPSTPGLASNDPATNGCPRFDRDHDGVFDDEDACPSTPGIRTNDPKTNGCPRPDRDGDQVYDDEDACVDVPGIRTDDPKTNGCPRPDRDNDHVFDDEDACPDVPGVRTDDPKTNGCPPPSGPVHAFSDRILLDDVILFALNSPNVRPSSVHLVGSVADFIRTNPNIVEVDIEGHADRRGTEEYNQALSVARASAVQAILLKYGVGSAKVTVHGFGKTRPKSTPDTPLDQLEQDRRVEFTIVKSSPASGGGTRVAGVQVP